VRKEARILPRGALPLLLQKSEELSLNSAVRQRHSPRHRPPQKVMSIIRGRVARQGQVRQAEAQPISVAESAVVGAEVAPVEGALRASSKPRAGSSTTNCSHAALLKDPEASLSGSLLPGLHLMGLQELPETLIKALRVPLREGGRGRHPHPYSLREKCQGLSPVWGK
jgi:hypothetical protein